MKTPLDVLIIRHKSEKPQKSTVSHVKEIIDNSDNIQWDPNYLEPNKISSLISHFHNNNNKNQNVHHHENMKTLFSFSLLLFPHKTAVDISEIENIQSFTQLTVIDGPWSKVNCIANQLISVGMIPVIIKERETRFWRYQPHSLYHLSSIEAIYYFFVDYHKRMTENGHYFHQFEQIGNEQGVRGDLIKNYRQEDDDDHSDICHIERIYEPILSKFNQQYQLIQEYYKQNPHIKFTTKRLGHENYIKY